MKCNGVSKRLILCAALLAMVSCGKLKKAAEEAGAAAVGFAPLSDEDQSKLLTSIGWDETQDKYKNLKVRFGFTVTDDSKFAPDFSQKYEWKIDVPVPQLEEAEKSGAAASKKKYMMLLKAVTLKLGDVDYTRLQVVSVVQFKNKTLTIDGAEFTKELDASQVISKANANQAGTYLIVQADGDGGIVGLQGDVTLKKNTSDVGAVADAYVFTSTSPFTGMSGVSGKYFTALLEGDGGQLFAYKKGIATTDTAPGTPDSASTAIVKAGLLDQYKGAVLEKGGEFGDTSKIGAVFDDINGKVTDYLDGWKVTSTPVQFVQPPEPPAAEAVPPAATEPPPAAPAEATPANADVAQGNASAERVSRGSATGSQVDLACTGLDASGKSTLLFDATSSAAGWHFFGDVRMSNASYDAIFPGDDRMLDSAKGYCLLSTGNGLYKSTGIETFKPKNDQSSEMWQKIKVPAASEGFKTIQTRIAFFSQEYPTYVGTDFNDSFYIKFDEDTAMLASGNLNQLGEVEDNDGSCASNYSTLSGIAAATDKAACGKWVSTYWGLGLNAAAGATGAELWEIGSSEQAMGNGDKAGCTLAAASSGKCFQGMIEPTVVCRDIPAQFQDKEVTLRIGVSDAGDQYYDSALAVDSIVFSKDDCGTTFTGEAAVSSRVLR